jgi:hypothetical protein
MWTEREFETFNRTFVPNALPRPESIVYGPRRFNYLKQVRLTCDFVARYQVSDSLSPDFGGIIEAENMPNIIETDNTQEAIWIWSRWYELTGYDDYRENIRRAWVYVKRFPAFREHGGDPQYIWYAVWNCGLGFMAEAEYRQVYGDSAFRAYADTCRTFYLDNALGSVNVLDVFVNGQSSGMACDYARVMNDRVLRDTALARGQRVKTWIEAGARTRLAYQNWAMSGGTAFWGVARTVCAEDTVAGKAWLETYTDSLPGFYPSGTWNCSHNIWLANANRASAEVTRDTQDWLMHHYLVDTLLGRDTDNDGGIPATWTDPPTQDQTWVSTYLDFMGMDVFISPLYDRDAAILEFVSPDPREVYVVGDSVSIAIPAANVGREVARDVSVSIIAGGMGIGVRIDSLPLFAVESLDAGSIPLDTAGLYLLLADIACTGDENPRNDSVRLAFKVYDTCRVNGTLVDSASGAGIPAWVKARIGTETRVWDSVYTDGSGQFSLLLLDSLFTLSIEPAVPYYARSWDFAIHGDTTVRLATQPAHVLVVNNDTLGRYSEYYTSTLDTLGVTWCTWKRPSEGLPPFPQVDRLRSRTVIWFSGNTNAGAIPAADCDSLAALVRRGANLFITGQSIAEELHGTVFLESICGVRFDSSGWAGFFTFGNRQDSLGAFVTGTATTGGNGAGNQTSRDVVSALGNSTGFLVYDSVSVRYSATRRQVPSGGRIVFAGFGFEAVNRPSSKPTFFNRMQLLGLILDWFGGQSGLAGEPQPPSLKPQALPTVVRGVLFLPGPSSLAPRPILLDVSGRRVADLRPGPNDLTRVPAGIYFVRSHTSHGPPMSHRLLLVR